MKLSKFVKAIREEFSFMQIDELSIDVGLNTNMTINQKSPNRVKFTLKRK